ncbi:MAG TPA: EamA family transporter [Bryobacteraceae bacterium]|nr:EamA family transporter [Bryobacteraceae bacterium]
MKWLWVAVTVISGTIGDVLCARGMAMHAELEDFRPQGIARILRYIVTHKLVLAGIAGDAISFFSFLALLSLTELNFAVPATALSYIFKTALARWYLREYVSWGRWAGALLVAFGIVLVSL